MSVVPTSKDPVWSELSYSSRETEEDYQEIVIETQARPPTPIPSRDPGAIIAVSRQIAAATQLSVLSMPPSSVVTHSASSAAPPSRTASPKHTTASLTSDIPILPYLEPGQTAATPVQLSVLSMPPSIVVTHSASATVPTSDTASLTSDAPVLPYLEPGQTAATPMQLNTNSRHSSAVSPVSEQDVELTVRESREMEASAAQNLDPSLRAQTERFSFANWCARFCCSCCIFENRKHK